MKEIIKEIIFRVHAGAAHSILLLMFAFVVHLLVAMFGYSGKIKKLFKKSSLFFMIFLHIQFLVGLGMLFIYSPFLDNLRDMGMGAIMKNAVLREKYVEHPFAMLLAVILMTIANKKIKANTHLSLPIVFLSLIVVVLILVRLPWSQLF